jgi:periplasmic nitrate reductase NapD
MSNLNIVGILVSAFPAEVAAIRPQIESLGAEVHFSHSNGKLVVTLEAESDAEIAETLVKLQDIQGVISAAMVYHGIDPVEQPEPINV